MPSGAESRRAPTRLQDDQGNWLTKSQFRRKNSGHNWQWERTLAKWRKQCCSLDIFELQALVAERDAELADARAQVLRERQGLSETRADLTDALRRADQLAQSLAAAQRAIEQLTAGRDRATDGLRAARKDARRAVTLGRRSQRSADAAERRAGLLEGRLATVSRECKHAAAEQAAAHANASYWQQRALSAEGQLRGAQRRKALAEAALQESCTRRAELEETERGAWAVADSCRSRLQALEELVREASIPREAACSSATGTPPRGEAESPVEPSLPCSPTSPTNAEGDYRPSPCAGGALGSGGVVCPPALFDADTDSGNTAATQTDADQNRSACSFDSKGTHNTDGSEPSAGAPHPTLDNFAPHAMSLMQLEEQIERERACSAAAEEFAVLALSFTQGGEVLMRQRTLSCQLHAARAELRLLPHAEITERGGLEIAESSARKDFLDPRHLRAVPEADWREEISVSAHKQRGIGDASTATATGSHPDSGWFLTLDIISLSVAPFAPRRWAPVSSSTARAVYCVHQHWLSASLEVHRKIVIRLDRTVEGPDEERFDWALNDWDAFIVQVRQTSNTAVGPKRILLMHAQSARNHLQRLRLDLQAAGQVMRHTITRIRTTTATMREVLGMEEESS